MKRLLLWSIALVIAVAPAAAEVCRLDCERPKPPECPLHQQTSHKCSHDHTIGAATLTPSNSGAPRPAGPPIAVMPGRATIEPIAFAPQRAARPHSPPPRSPRIDVLRI